MPFASDRVLLLRIAYGAPLTFAALLLLIPALRHPAVWLFVGALAFVGAAVAVAAAAALAALWRRSPDVPAPKAFIGS
jgi:hypothetical protein